jgi:hypothetical protein
LVPQRAVGRRVASAAVHLPAIDPGLSAGLWAIGLGLFIFLGMVALGVSAVVSLIVAGLSAFGIFLYVRLYGRDAEA